MLLRRKTEKQGLLSVATGELIPVSQVPDEVFSQKLLGDGYAVLPEENTIFSPVTGKIVGISDTLHAFSITSDDGLEILVHIGIDTVTLQGEGFAPKVSAGDRVKAGDVLAVADFKMIEQRGLSTITPVLITNMEKIKRILPRLGWSQGGVSRALEYKTEL